MPVYNGVPYLREAIGSVLSQSFTGFEFLIINDCSTDASVACIKSCKDPRIRLLHNERNLGQAETLNRGLREARSPYIARIDQDDACLPGRFQKQVDYLDRNPNVAVVGGWARRIDSQGRHIGWFRERGTNFGEYLAHLLLTRCPLQHPSVMFRKDIVLESGGYDKAYAPAEDYELWVRLATRGHRAHILQEPVIDLRAHQQQQSRTKDAIQRANNNRAQHRMIESFSGLQDATAVASLLRMDWDFWRECNSKDRICAALDALDRTLAEITRKLSLTRDDFRSLHRVLYRWIGPGATFRKPLQLLPSFIFYPIFITLCPLLIPNIRILGFRVIDRLQRIF